jgi:hypothetical protein
MFVRDNGMNASFFRPSQAIWPSHTRNPSVRLGEHIREMPQPRHSRARCVSSWWACVLTYKDCTNGFAIARALSINVCAMGVTVRPFNRRHHRRNASNLRRTARGWRGFNGIRHRRDSLGATISNEPSTTDMIQQQETECFRLN